MLCLPVIFAVEMKLTASHDGKSTNDVLHALAKYGFIIHIGRRGGAAHGGAWNNNADNLRCAIRNRNHPDNRNNNIGFRLVLSV